MTDFYTLLARHYDTLFPAEPEISDFLSRTFSPARGSGALIDAACGTGNYTHALSKRGFACHGFDASEEMIGVALETGKLGTFEVRALEDLGGLAADTAGGGASQTEAASARPQAASPRPQGLFCIGNSLPHLTERAAVARFFQDAAGLLEPGSRMVVQIVNFARFDPPRYGRDKIELPSVERPEVTMRRSYRSGGEPRTVLFHTELTTSEGGRTSGVTPLLALGAEELAEAAEAAGFGEIDRFGSYEGAPYDPAVSFLCILTAKAGDV
jgi:SAM-dependent methyltransferase